VALTYVTGQNLVLTIKLPSTGSAVTFVNIASSCTLTLENNLTELETLNGRAYKNISKSGTLDVELYQDWGSTGVGMASVCEALFTAAKDYPDTLHDVSFTANGKVFTLQVYPAYPAIGGSAPDVLTSTVSFTVYRGIATMA